MFAFGAYKPGHRCGSRIKIGNMTFNIDLLFKFQRFTEGSFAIVFVKLLKQCC